MTSAGLSTGAKAGIAIGIIGATLLGVVVGWIVVGRRRKVNDTESQASVHLPLQTGYYEPGKVEQPPQYRHEVSGQPAAPVLYEL
jgi:LPXTG-motif cell wall-anchored protein